MTYGEEFQEQSKYSREKLKGRRLDWAKKTGVYKHYPPDLPRFALPEPVAGEEVSLFRLLAARRSVRSYEKRPLSSPLISSLLWASQGISLVTPGHHYRTAPSAGGLYPIETYLANNRGGELPQGIFHYEVSSHRLALLKEGKFGPALAGAALEQSMVENAPIVLIWSALVERSRWKYDQRAYRYIYLDAGHIAQNVALAAVSLGLGSCQIGAFFDDEVNSILGLDGKEETVIYMSVAGYPV